MRANNNEEMIPISRVRRGKAVVVGIGTDDSCGHVRYTQGESFKLYGGSEESHSAMLEHVALLKRAIRELGISLDAMTYPQYVQLRDLVERYHETLQD